MGPKKENLENLHIPLWLLKDTCWMMEWKILGMVMILPTMFLAIRIAVSSFRNEQFLPNLAVCFWITANAYWMVCEFFFNDAGKEYAMIFFVFGLVSVTYHYVKAVMETSKAGV